jgi:hypothetical protein
MRVAPLVALLSAVASVPAAFAGGSASATMHVSVEVVARTIVTIDHQPDVVTVTQQDIDRGYVEVPAAVAFRIRSNAQNGYAVQFEAVGYPFTRAKIAWGSQSAVVTGDSSWLTRPYEPGEQPGSFNVTLDVAANTTPGTYPWPVRFDANSL